MERDVCGLVLSVNVQINKPFSDETAADRVLRAVQQQASRATTVATGPPTENLDQYNAELDRICLDNVKACEDVHKKSVLPELRRLEECIEK